MSDRVWRAGLWQVPRSFNVEEGLVQAIQALYENSISPVLLNNQLGELTTEHDRQGCLLTYPVRFVPEETHTGNTMTTTHPFPLVEGTLCNLRFTDNIGLMGGSNGELQDLANRIVDRAMQDHDQQHKQHQCRY